MNDKDKTEQLAKLVQNIDNAVQAAMQFADDNALKFNLDVAYGMGGTYFGKTLESRESIDRNYDNGGWLASSQSC
jgi:hypothetical protein